MKIFVRSFFFLFLMGCKSLHQNAELSSYSFPQNFSALQLIEIHWQNKHTILADVKREGEFFRVVFLEPVMQSPLLVLEKQNSRSQSRVEYMTERKLSFDANEILSTITELHETERIEGTSGSLCYHSVKYEYCLFDFKGSELCLYPRRIIIRSKADTSLAIAVLTREIQCD